MDAGRDDFKTPSASATTKGSDQGHSRFEPGSGYYGEPVTNTSGGAGTTKVNTPPAGNQTTNTGSKSTFMPFTLQLAKKLVFDPLQKHTRQQKAKGETFFGKPKDLPATRDYYRATGKPLDVMSKTGVDYMKDAGLIKPPKVTTPTGGGGGQQLCPDGTYPPCKTPVTQIKKPVSKANSFLSDFQSYDDGGEIVISSNVDKNLL